jgi:hypothetical protein
MPNDRVHVPVHVMSYPYQFRYSQVPFITSGRFKNRPTQVLEPSSQDPIKIAGALNIPHLELPHRHFHHFPSAFFSPQNGEKIKKNIIRIKNVL